MSSSRGSCAITAGPSALLAISLHLFAPATGGNGGEVRGKKDEKKRTRRRMVTCIWGK